MVSHANGHPNFVAQFLVPLIVDRVLRLAQGHRPVRDGVVLGQHRNFFSTNCGWIRKPIRVPVCLLDSLGQHTPSNEHSGRDWQNTDSL